MLHNRFMAKSSTSQFTVRLEDSLRTSLEESAKAHQRSLQMEIVTRLLGSLGVRDDGDSKIASIAREVFKEEVAKIVIERLMPKDKS